MSVALTRIGGMSNLASTLERLGDELAGAVRETLASDAMRGMTDPEILELMAVAARIVRSGEALLVEATGQVDLRSEAPAADARMTTRFGCRSVSELVQRTTRMSSRTAGDYLRASRAVRWVVAPTTGERLPAELPRLREAMTDSHIGVDGVVAIA